METYRKPTEEEVAGWLDKHGLISTEFEGTPEGKAPLPDEKLQENIKVNAQRHDVPNLRASLYSPRKMVFVGGGPSAGDFVEEIRARSLDSKCDVFCSNATAKWLLSKGIVPKYQVIIDPKASKTLDVMHGNEEITYLLGMQCDPRVFDAVKGKKIFKFLAYSTQADWEMAKGACTPEDPEVLSIGGGTMMGTRALTLAEALGYREIEYFGFDGSIRLTENVEYYAYEKPRGEAIIETTLADGKTFDTTLTFARQAEELELFLTRMPGLEVTIHGDGLLAHALKLFRERQPKQAAYRISPEYLAMQREMAPSYEGAGRVYAGRVYLLLSQVMKAKGVASILDYGCGKGALFSTMKQAYMLWDKVSFREYEPTRDKGEPFPADIVTCTDVLEHVEEECVEAVLDHLQELTKGLLFCTVNTAPALKTLPDGRNAHITQRPAQWWKSHLRKRFVILEASTQGATVIFVCQSFPKEVV